MMSVIAFGNPLLDTTITITDDYLLRKYNLKNDDQKEINREVMGELLKDISKFSQMQTAGGCGQNTLRVMQWLYMKKFSTTIFGAVGQDGNGVTLQGLLQADGVEVCYVRHNNYPTGTTVALINGHNRALLAYLGAAEILTVDNLSSTPEILTKCKAADLIYLEGFFLTQRGEVAKFILDYCIKHKRKFAFNLSGEYLCNLEPENVKYFAEKCDILFGNRREFEALSCIWGLPRIDDLLKVLVLNGDKTIVVTNGAHSVVCVHSGGVVDEIPVRPVDRDEVVDTTGAGDAFVAGFLTGYLLKRTPTNCSELGCYAAQEIIRMTGCTLPQHPPSVLL